MVVGPKEAALRRARSCYDHLAGRLGVAIAEKLQDEGALLFEGEAWRTGPAAGRALGGLGIAVERSRAASASRRPLCCPCLDWSERRPHLAGSLGALICTHCIDQRWLTRRAGSRALDISPQGERALRGWLGEARWAGVVSAPA